MYTHGFAHISLDPTFFGYFGPMPQHTLFANPDHAHDLVSSRPLIGPIGFLGNNPSTWMSKLHVSIASSTYAAEFIALRTSTEDEQSLGYMI